MEKEILLTQGDLQIPCKLTEPEDGLLHRVVLGIHGICGSSDDDIQAALAQEMDLFHAATLRFDFPGHGANPLGSEAFTLENCRQTLLCTARYAREAYPTSADLCIFATGFGAYVTLLCLEELQELPGRLKLVVQTPAVMFHKSLLAMGQTTEPTLAAMGSLLFRAKRPLSVSHAFYQEALHNPALNTYDIPFLILHGEADDFIPMEDIRHLRRLNEASKLVILPGIRHRFLEEGAWDMVLDLTRDWFECEQVLMTDWE